MERSRPIPFDLIVFGRSNNNGEMKQRGKEMEKERERNRGACKKKKGFENEHLAGEYVIIGRDNDRVASSCLWRDCRSRR